MADNRDRDDDPDDASDDFSNESEKEESKPATMKEMIIRIGGIGNFGLQCLNVALVSTGMPLMELTTPIQVGRGMIYGSSALGAVNSPVVVYKERLLTNEDTFRTALNGIREEQGRLSEQNDVLTAEVDDLQSEVDRMKDVEMALRELSETQGSQLGELMDLIAENKEINQGMRGALKSQAVEAIIGLVLDMDADGSFTIESKEVERLIVGMGNLENGLTFDKDMFRENVKSCGGNVDEVISLIKRMINGTVGEDGDDRCTIEVVDPEEYFKKKRSTR